MAKKKRLLITDVLKEDAPESKSLGDVLEDFDLVWTCGDCGNRYGPDTKQCPNGLLDALAVRGYLS